ncbi:MAG: hypothetical protein ABI781_11475 [Burkholderiales bacterium]
MQQMPSGTVRRADQPDDFKRFGVNPAEVEPFEDGRRSGDGPGRFEWWYFDARLADGAYVAVLFFTKPFAHPGAVLDPVVSISIKPPGKEAVTKTAHFAATTFTASEARCDVTIDDNTFDGDLLTYRIHAKVEDLEVDAELTRLVDPLRLGTGHLLFENATDQHFFGWLAAVPRGAAKVSYRVGDVVATGVAGDGYHDHNWGDIDMSHLIHDWYWGRATVGGYTVIAVQLTAQKAYGSTRRTEFVLIDKDGGYLAKGNANVAFDGSDTSPDDQSGVPVANRLIYTFTDGPTQYVATFDRREALLQKALDGEFTPNDPEASGAYLRFASLCTLERIDAEGRTTLGKGGTTWELMWFGSQPDPRLLELYAQTLTSPKQA